MHGICIFRFRSPIFTAGWRARCMERNQVRENRWSREMRPPYFCSTESRAFHTGVAGRSARATLQGIVVLGKSGKAQDVVSLWLSRLFTGFWYFLFSFVSRSFQRRSPCMDCAKSAKVLRGKIRKLKGLRSKVGFRVSRFGFRCVLIPKLSRFALESLDCQRSRRSVEPSAMLIESRDSQKNE